MDKTRGRRKNGDNNGDGAEHGNDVRKPEKQPKRKPPQYLWRTTYVNKEFKMLLQYRKAQLHK